MKKLLLIVVIALFAGQLSTVSAQISVSVNIEKQPAWGPTGYDRANFYYFPDLNIYFDVNNSLFYYVTKSRWTSSNYLPSRYSQYDLYRMYKVVINNSSKPWTQNRTHQNTYAKFRGNTSQSTIRSTKNTKYEKSRNNTRPWVNGSSNSGNSSVSSQKDKSKTDGVNNSQSTDKRNNSQNSQQSQQKNNSQDMQQNQQKGSSQNNNRKEDSQNSRQKNNSQNESRKSAQGTNAGSRN